MGKTWPKNCEKMEKWPQFPFCHFCAVGHFLFCSHFPFSAFGLLSIPHQAAWFTRCGSHIGFDRPEIKIRHKEKLRRNAPLTFRNSWTRDPWESSEIDWGNQLWRLKAWQWRKFWIGFEWNSQLRFKEGRKRRRVKENKENRKEE